MYISDLSIRAFRMIDELDLSFRKGTNVLIGENNSGKTAVIDAIRICLGMGYGRRELWVAPDDLHVNDKGDIATEIGFDLTFKGLDAHEAGPFIEMLAKGDDDTAELQLHVRFQYDKESGRMKSPRYWGGAKEGQQIPGDVLDLLYFVHLGALRDAARDVSPGRGSRIAELMMNLVPDEAKQKQYADDINDRIKQSEEWKKLLSDAESKINDHLQKLSIAGSVDMTRLSFIESQFRRIVEGLRLVLPRATPNKSEETSQVDFAVRQNGLGANNLIYASAVLGDLIERRGRKPLSYNALLIEEPEAHLHPQLQNVFLGYLKQIELHGIQVFVTSHSPTITAKTDIASVTVLSRTDQRHCALNDLPLLDKHRQFLTRFLDVTKSQLFFAKGVILVEGTSEQLLIPVLAKRLQNPVDLEVNGIEVVNVGGVAFEPFALLFNGHNGSTRLQQPCAILTDDDRDTHSESNEVTDQNDSSETDFEDEISARAAIALDLAGGSLGVFLAKRTLEYELFRCNEELLMKAYRELHPKTQFSTSDSAEERANDFLSKLQSNRDKAILAQLLAWKIENNGEYSTFKVPDYIQEGIKWVCSIDDTDGKTAENS